MRVLFAAHRDEILGKALDTFPRIRPPWAATPVLPTRAQAPWK